MRRSLANTHREISRQWHPTQNGDLLPQDVTAGSDRRVWWQCPKGPDHEWQAAICDRARYATACPFCSGRRVSSTNSLAARYAEVAAQWHPTKNGKLTPADVTAGTTRRVWWRCHEGPDHEWQATVCSRTSKLTGCPFCSGLRVSMTNSLATCQPALAAEWHPTRNGKLTPADVTWGSSKRVWWRCSRESDHEWQAVVNSRMHNDPGCPFCRKQRVDPERSLARQFPWIAAEWHPTRNGSVTPVDVSYGSSKMVWWRCSKGADHEWQTTVNNRTNKGNDCPFCSGRRASATGNLAVVFPKIAAEWHLTKNGDLTPSEFRPKSSKRVWWRCRYDPTHEWQTTIASRTMRGRGCPFCSGNRVTPDLNLAVVFPEIAAEWHPTKNGDLTPSDVRPGAKWKVWWRCAKGADHEWQTTVNHRATHGHGCPFCSGRRLSVTNSLATLYPELAREWHPMRNGDVTPADVKPGSHERAWWKCARGRDHQWRARVSQRSRGNAGCPFCDGSRVSTKTCLATCFPELAEQWHPTKNGDLTPEEVRPDSAKRVWWQCPDDPQHQWQSPIRCRAILRERCPFCADVRQGPRAGIARAGIAARYPQLAAEWHPLKNGFLSPANVARSSRKLVWWTCAAGPDHQWQATVYSRTTHGLGCPFCAGRRVSVTNCLADHYPDLAAEWHPARNDPKSPADLPYTSRARVWWQCAQDAGHQWQARVSDRVRGGHACPICAREQRQRERSLAALHPALVAEWHSVRNRPPGPDQSFPTSHRKVWWRCRRGHVWFARIVDRARKGQGCPTCAVLHPGDE